MLARNKINTWADSVTCQHYFPGDGVIDTQWHDIVGNVVLNPQNGYEFQHDSSLVTVKSTAPISATKEPLASGSWNTFAAGKSLLVLTAGYTDLQTVYSVTLNGTGGVVTVTHNAHPYSTGDNVTVWAATDVNYNTASAEITVSDENTYTYIGPGTGVDDTANIVIAAGNAIRTLAIGDFGGGSAGIGLSDGASSTLQGHVLFGDNAGGFNGSRLTNGDLITLGQRIENNLGQGSYFYRYALYKPNGLLTESAAYDLDTGSAISDSTNNQSYLGTDVLGSCSFDALFRMSNYKSTGIAIFYFDTVPQDYLQGIREMAYEWKLGNRFIWPYW
jgi:hypothetical protein